MGIKSLHKTVKGGTLLVGREKEKQVYKSVVKILRKDSLILKYKDAVLGEFRYEDIRPEIMEDL